MIRERYRCALCGAHYVRRFAYEQHMIKKHDYRLKTTLVTTVVSPAGWELE